jgi:hypothetical protein
MSIILLNARSMEHHNLSRDPTQHRIPTNEVKAWIRQWKLLCTWNMIKGEAEEAFI